MLTVEPGPDVAPYHARQPVVLPQTRWTDWLSGEPNEGELLRPSQAGSLVVTNAS
jgi:putative SOS response-associated peptidase YedK